MDAYKRLAACRMLTKISEDPEYSKTLGLVSNSSSCILVMPGNNRKGDSQINGITEKEYLGKNDESVIE